MANTVDLLQIKIERAKEKLPAETSNAIAAVDWKAVISGIREKKGYNFEQLGDLELETELLLCGLVSSADYPKEIQNRMKISRAETDELVNQMNELVFKKIKEELIKNTERKKIFQKKPEENPFRVSGGSGRPSASNGTSQNDITILKSAGIEVIKPVPVRNTFSIADAGGENREAMLERIEHPASTRIIEPMRGGPAPTSVVEPMRGEPETPRMGDIHPMLTQKILGAVQVPIVKTEHTIENIIKTPAIKKPEVTSTPNALKKDPYRLSPDE